MSHAEPSETPSSNQFRRRISHATAITLDVFTVGIFVSVFAAMAWLLIGLVQAMSSFAPTHDADPSQNLEVVGFILLSAVPLAAFYGYRALSRRRTYRGGSRNRADRGYLRSRASNSWSMEQNILRKVLLVNGLLLGVMFVPLLNTITFIVFDRIGLLWCYVGIAFSCLAFAMTFQLRKRQTHRLRDSLVSAVRWFVIIFGAVGILLMLGLFVIPGYQPSTLGRWIQAKLWLDAGQVRQWAVQQQVTPPAGDGIPYARWPSSLQQVSNSSARIRIGPEKSVTVHWGGMFGHWGITIADPISGREDGLKVEPGVWVWESRD